MQKVMLAKLCIVSLSEEERQSLEKLIKNGKAAALVPLSE